MGLEFNSRIIGSGDAFASRIDSDLVIFDPVSEFYYGSGVVGAEIWEYIKVERTVGDVCSHIADVFQVEIDQCRDDVVEFLSVLVENGLARSS